MSTDVKKKVESCLVCTKTKGFTAKPAGLSVNLGVPDLPFEHIHVDFSGPIDKSHRLAVVVDRLTSFTIFWASQTNATAATLAQEVVQEVIRIFGLPRRLTSDNDVLLTSKFWRGIMQKCGVAHLTTTVHRPEANGKVERRMRTIKEGLTTSLRGDISDWKEHLPALAFAINSTTSDGFELSPAKALLGFTPRGPIENFLPTTETQLDSGRFQSVKEDALARIQQIARRRDAQRREANFQTGDQVVVHREALGESLPPLKPAFAGPLEVDGVDEHGNLMVRRGNRTAHIHPESAKVVVPGEDEDDIASDADEYEVERIVDASVERNVVRLQLK